jgi:hypothetical protein
VSLDQDEQQLRSVLKEKGLDFPVFFSGQGWSDPIARSFGVTGIPNSFVIGRDGRFASDSLHGSQLAGAIEAALAAPREAAYASGKKPARLNIRTTLDGDDVGIPGLKIKLQAIDAVGRPVRNDELDMRSPADRIVWLYPRLDGGRIVAWASGAGLNEQEKTLDSPTGEDRLTFSFASPRRVTGRVTARDSAGVSTGAPGIKVTLVGNHGMQRSALSNDDGTFQVAALAGNYRLSVEGSEKFAPIAPRANTMTVAAESDPEPIMIEVSRATVVKGSVVDGHGGPVAGAKVRSTAGPLTVTTNDKGEFELAGVPSAGPATIFASKDRLSGRVVMQDYDGKSQPQITLGLPVAQSSQRRLPAGSNIPPLTAWKLDGEQVEWRPGGDRNCLIVFCALGHPAGRAFLHRAVAWAQEHKVHLAAFSIDWTVEQAARESAAIRLETPLLFAGPGGLVLTKNWSVIPPAQALLVSAEGNVVRSPEPSNLP